MMFYQQLRNYVKCFEDFSSFFFFPFCSSSSYYLVVLLLFLLLLLCRYNDVGFHSI